MSLPAGNHDIKGADGPGPGTRPRTPYDTVRGGFALLMPGELVSMIALFGLIVAVGVVEAAVIALVIPVVQSINDPAFLTRTAPFSRVAPMLGFQWGHGSFVWLAAIMALLILASSAGSLLISFLVDRQAAASRIRLGNRLLSRLVDAPYLWFTNKSSSVLSRQIFSDIGTWRQDFLQSFLLLGQSFVMIALPSVVAIAMAPLQGLAAIVLVGGIGVASVLMLRPWIYRLAARQKANMNGTLRLLIQIISGVREVKVSNRARFFVDKFNAIHATGNGLMVWQRLMSQIPPVSIIVFGQLGFLAAAYLLWTSGMSGSEITARLAMIAVVVTRVVPAMNKAAAQFGKLSASFPFVQGLLELMDDIAAAERDYGRAPGTLPVPEAWRAVRFEHVSLRYPDATDESLRDISIELECGRRYGIVGRSGAGKTSFVNALLGLIQPTSGRVAIDGQDLGATDLAQWHDQIGYVPQDIFLIDDNLRANIAFGEPPEKHDEALLAEVVRQSQLEAVVARLSHGLDSPLGEKGRGLSGGQAQRVAIARALYRRPRIVLLDEATSALDSVTERIVQRSFNSLAEDVLGIAVAHRVTSLRNCHEIVVMDDGRIQDIGTYDALLQRNALFRELAAQRVPQEEMDTA